MADPTGSNYAFGAPRHAPRPEFTAPDLQDEKRPNHTFSNPAGQTQSWNSTGSLMNNPRRKSPRPGGQVSASDGVESPLDLSNADDIVSASGLGPGTKDGEGLGEAVEETSRAAAEGYRAGRGAGQADPPTQGVHADENGNMSHYRANPSGSVTRTPLGSFAGGSYGATMPDYFGQG